MSMRCVVMTTCRNRNLEPVFPTGVQGRFLDATSCGSKLKQSALHLFAASTRALGSTSESYAMDTTARASPMWSADKATVSSTSEIAQFLNDLETPSFG